MLFRSHQVEFFDLFSADGRLIPNVPEFNVAHYGTGWFFKSPYAGKSYWVGIDKISEVNGKTSFYELNSFVSIESGLIKESTATGNYVKVEIEEHFSDSNRGNSESYKIIIKHSSKKGIIDQLSCFGISKATLHPELYKVAEYIKEKY